MSGPATTRALETTRAPRQVLFAYAAPALSSSFVFTAVSLFPVACHLLALILLTRIRLDERAHAQIRQQINERGRERLRAQEVTP